jgi:hypothetical protein
MSNNKIYRALNLTWGLPMTLVGYIAKTILKFAGFKLKQWGGCVWFEIGEHWGGVSLGMVIITCKDATEETLNHEFGHSIQNAIFGIFFPFVVAIPSAARYWKRIADEKKGKILEPYDAIWFEGQATMLGNKYIHCFQSNETRGDK